MTHSSPQRATPLRQLRHQIPGQAYLWVAVLIFGASSAVTRKITDIGAQNFVGGKNPISLCNVLFVGNLCALLIFAIIHRQQWRWTMLSQRTKEEWRGLAAVAVLSGALAPGLIFQALALTPVTNVVLISRLEPPLTLALSLWLLHDRVNRWELMGAIAAFIGVALTVLLQPAREPMMQVGAFHLGVGELLAAAGAIALSTSTILGKKRLSKVPLGVFSLTRTGLGTVIFFIAAIVLYGSDHFMGAFAPFLWQWMLLYGGVIVVVGQTFWLTGLRASSVSTASIVGSFAPIFGILAAYLILGEVPTRAQYIGGGVILLGLFLGQIGLQKAQSRATTMIDAIPAAQAIEAEMGFKGI
ncbi:MAG: DMT family transporter [Stenomitos rutilans HA7619-LM2]|jgi:drug/metabolite transporter (DMT)-like permease|nr:DMT family transporter [Stenomitos rutilans HA7619-LM2]